MFISKLFLEYMTRTGSYVITNKRIVIIVSFIQKWMQWRDYVHILLEQK